MNLTRSQDLEGQASDEKLMIAAGRGDQAAFEKLVLRYRTSAWNTAYRFIGDGSEAEDIIQEAFLRIWASARRYRPTALFRTYLHRILIRICLDHSAKKRPLYSDQVPEPGPRAHSALERLANEERERAVRAALDRLPPNQRMALTLRYFEGLCYSEIAEMMEISTKAVERLLARARDNLQQELAHLLD
jgi:RNA polymerase sigma-70 factor (ECF subfamily)